MSSDGPQDAPQDWRGVIKHLGPGLIITACIVGSGELIATPKVGAEYGFSLLWFIIAGCMIKVLVQVELGRFAISKGMTTLEAMNTMPGPRFIVSWLVWCWLFMFIGILFQLGGIVGGVGKVVAELGWFNGLDGAGFFKMDRIIAIAVSGATVAILASGKYKTVEIFSTIMVVFFTIATLFALGSLQTSPAMAEFKISWADVGEGLKFRLPGDFSTAFAAFGIIGVGASELIYYPYWCLEKGYARNVGTANPTTVWYERTKGWLRIMRIDAWLSMVIYTGATVAFFLLGAALLHGSGKEVNDGNMIASLSEMYRPLGELGLTIFLLGAFVVLFSTMVTASASNARLLADGLVLFERIEKPKNDEARGRLLSKCCIAVPVFCALVYFFIGAPVSLVLVGGVAQALMLPFLAIAALYFRYKQTDEPLKPGAVWTVFLWISALAMAAVGLFQLYQKLS
jgi:Mn2+/Fe2+ NRAMP family transporter